MEDVVTRPHQVLIPGENELPLSELWPPPLYFKPRNPAFFCTLLYSCLWVRFCLNKVFSGVGGGLSYTHSLSETMRNQHRIQTLWSPWPYGLEQVSWFLLSDTQTQLTAPSLTLLTTLLVKIKWGTLPTRGTTQPFIVCLMNFGLARWGKKKVEECLNKPAGLVHTYNPITREGRGLLLVQGQPNELVGFSEQPGFHSGLFVS